MLVFVAMIPVFYKLQSWSHKIWTVADDMSEFNKRFPPGRALSTILLIYEVPICLNYLLFRRQGLETLRRGVVAPRIRFSTPVHRFRPRAITMLCESLTGKTSRLSSQRFTGPALCKPSDSMSGVSHPPR